MPLKKGGFDQLFNVQALATAGRQVILAVMRHDSPDDTAALHPLLAQGRAVLDAAGIPGPVGKAVFDAGYASDANFTAAAEAELYVAVARESVQAGRSSDGRRPQPALPSWQDMAARLGTPGGRAVYSKRAATIEPVFAQLTARLGRALHYRGDMTDAELSLWAASHNLLKAITARTARQARQARAAQAAPVPACA
jgi:Transposase DDE domain